MWKLFLILFFRSTWQLREECSSPQNEVRVPSAQRRGCGKSLKVLRECLEG
jgi:hypothetical protein